MTYRRIVIQSNVQVLAVLRDGQFPRLPSDLDRVSDFACERIETRYAVTQTIGAKIYAGKDPLRSGIKYDVAAWQSNRNERRIGEGQMHIPNIRNCIVDLIRIKCECTHLKFVKKQSTRVWLNNNTDRSCFAICQITECTTYHAGQITARSFGRTSRYETRPERQLVAKDHPEARGRSRIRHRNRVNEVTAEHGLSSRRFESD